MMEIWKDKGFLRLLAVFLISTAAMLLFRVALEDAKVDTIVLGAGNLIIFLASLLTLYMYGRAKKSTSPHGFTNRVFAGFALKFFILVAAAMLYFYFSRDNISVRAVFVCFGLYLVYHFAGASYAARVEKKHGKKHGHH